MTEDDMRELEMPIVSTKTPVNKSIPFLWTESLLIKLKHQERADDEDVGE